MKDYQPFMSFGDEQVAEFEDVQRGDEPETVTFLERLARGGDALELAIGAGRIALPLAARGIRVEGIDFSPAMVNRMRAKRGGNDIPVTMGDFADVGVPGPYKLIYLVFNTLFNLLTQDDQVRCFENVAARLTADGAFVIEAFVPSFLYRLRNDQYVDAEQVNVDSVILDIGRHDPVHQTLDESHVKLSPEGIRVCPVVCRYAWPCELDLMARIAGLRLKERWAGWQQEPFTSTSPRHVSVYTW
jgi:SAM-dependent methyltransferase